jgi:hypothetical protein
MLESKQAKNFTMSMREAKDLHGDITKLLLALHELRNVTEAKDNEQDTIELNGGDF